MAPEFTIANRQKRHELEGLDIQAMANSIGHEVCRNLTQNQCEWLSPDQIKQIEELGSFSLVFVLDNDIQKLNKEWRGKDKPTDVISFPLDLEPEIDNVPFEVGEIYISVDKAVEQAQDYGHSLGREIAFLITHGLLHVLGFDHQSEEEEKDMFGRQNHILDLCNFKR